MLFLDELKLLKKSMAPSVLLPPIVRTPITAKAEGDVTDISKENKVAETIIYSTGNTAILQSLNKNRYYF